MEFSVKRCPERFGANNLSQVAHGHGQKAADWPIVRGRNLRKFQSYHQKSSDRRDCADIPSHICYLHILYPEDLSMQVHENQVSQLLRNIQSQNTSDEFHENQTLGHLLH